MSQHGARTALEAGRGGMGLQAAQEAKETTIQALNRALNEKITELHATCSRLDSFADRLEPQPKAPAEAAKTPPISNDLQGMNQRISAIGESLDWLNHICNRLERIA